ncbi:fimbria/pilus chaperone family protein [Candidatus Regiella endosymbiont of Tuberolachnus salignus]|uniref:fimbria/pilus chaperone family protein n=1 Tax=Candidatus Regiella endosymbiont of Tuberolachnus salignus TaxID=3077956 RepID=UPI0030CDA33E
MPIKNIIVLLLSFIFFPATGITGYLKPHTSVVIIEADEGEQSFLVKNEADYPLMMLTTLQTLPEDPEKLLTVTPPVSRVEAGDTQVVRFILKRIHDLKTERLSRVIFEGIPPKNDKSTKNIAINLAQNMPVIVRPKGLKRDYAPWKHLQWKIANNSLTVHNPSPYVVRFHSVLTLLPAQSTASLPDSYILPGKTLFVTLPAQKSPVTSVRLTPASLYGYMHAPVALPVTAS